MNRAALIALVVVGAAVFFARKRIVAYVQDRTVIGPNYKEDASGVVRVTPVTILSEVNASLRGQAMEPVTLDALALARAIRSEHGSEPFPVREWVAWAVKNSAKREGMSVFKRLTDSRNADTRGLFARQRVDARYAATNQAARLEDLILATSVLDSKDDPTRGATNFFSPKTQDALYALAQKGDARYVSRITRDADATRKLWQSRGLVSVGSPPGSPPGIVEFFAQA